MSGEKRAYYKTDLGCMFLGKSEEILSDRSFESYKGKVKLVFTSPPFPLNRKKKYGNLQGEDYIEWLKKYAVLLRDFLTGDGSIAIEIGNAWEPGSPTMSTLPMEALLAFKDAGKYYLCQEFIYFNPARLPSPVQWVNKERIRVKDSFSRIWWLSTTPKPDADNRRVLQAYSDKMKKLISSKSYNSGKRPSEHKIGEKSFAKDNGGAIPPNVIIASNTSSQDAYIKYCKSKNIRLHPARMPKEIADFFIKFLTVKGDVVLDPFSGSNMTGATAESNNRKWLSIEASREYADGSIGRFQNNKLKLLIDI